MSIMIHSHGSNSNADSIQNSHKNEDNSQNLNNDYMKIMAKFNSAKEELKGSKKIKVVRNSMCFGNINLFTKKFSHVEQNDRKISTNGFTHSYKDIEDVYSRNQINNKRYKFLPYAIHYKSKGELNSDCKRETNYMHWNPHKQRSQLQRFKEGCMGRISDQNYINIQTKEQNPYALAVSDLPRKISRTKSRPNIMPNGSISKAKESKSHRLVRGRASSRSNSEVEFQGFFKQLETGYGRMMKGILKNLKKNTKEIMNEKRNSTQRASRFKGLQCKDRTIMDPVGSLKLNVNSRSLGLKPSLQQVNQIMSNKTCYPSERVNLRSRSWKQRLSILYYQQ